MNKMEGFKQWFTYGDNCAVYAMTPFEGMDFIDFIDGKYDFNSEIDLDFTQKWFTVFIDSNTDTLHCSLFIKDINGKTFGIEDMGFEMKNKYYDFSSGFNCNLLKNMSNEEKFTWGYKKYFSHMRDLKKYDELCLFEEKHFDEYYQLMEVMSACLSKEIYASY